MFKLRTPKKSLFILAMMMSVFLKAQERATEFPSPDAFQNQFPDDLNSSHLFELRSRIDFWIRQNQERLLPVYELEQKSKLNSRLLELIDQVSVPLSSTAQELPSDSKSPLKPQYDVDQDGQISLLDFYLAERAKSWIQVCLNFSFTEQQCESSEIQYQELHEWVDQSINRYNEIKGSQSASREFANLVQSLENLKYFVWLTALENEIRHIHQVQEIVTRHFTENPSWRHRPREIPMIHLKKIDRAEIQNSLSLLVENIPAANIKLKTLYPALYEEQNEGVLLLNYGKALSEIIPEIQKKSDVFGSLEHFMDVLKNEKTAKTPIKIDAIHLGMPETSWVNRAKLFRSYDSKVVTAVFNQKGAYLKTLASLKKDLRYYSDWIDLLGELKSLGLDKYWENKNRLVTYVNMASAIQGSAPFIAVQWISNPTDPMPDFVKARETITWRTMEDPVVENWVAEYATAFYKARTEMQNLIAQEKGLDLNRLRTQVRTLNKNKADLRSMQVDSNVEQSERIDQEIEAINDLIDITVKNIALIELDPRLKKYDPTLPQAYAEKKGWPSAHDPARLAQIEKYLGFSSASRKLSVFLDATKETTILDQLDINKDGVIDGIDLGLRNILPQILN